MEIKFLSLFYLICQSYVLSLNLFKYKINYSNRNYGNYDYSNYNYCNLNYAEVML